MYVLSTVEDEMKSKFGRRERERKREGGASTILTTTRRLGGLPASGELCKRFKTFAERINNQGPTVLRHDRVSLRQMAS